MLSITSVELNAPMALGVNSKPIVAEPPACKVSGSVGVTGIENADACMPTLVTLAAMFPVLVIVRVTAAVLPTEVLGKKMMPLLTGENVRFAPCPVPARVMEMPLLIKSWAVRGPILVGVNTTLNVAIAPGFRLSWVTPLANAKFDPTTLSGIVSTALLVFVTRNTIGSELWPTAVFGNDTVPLAETVPPDVTLSTVNGATPWPERGIVV